MPDRVDLLILGDANPDLVLTGDVEPAFGQRERLLDGAHLTVGGSGAIVACGAARLGLRVAFCGVVGDDLFGRFMRDELDRRGVDVKGLVVEPDRSTGLTVVLARPDDRAILTHEGTIGDLRAGSIDPELLAAASHVHVASYFLQSAPGAGPSRALRTGPRERRHHLRRSQLGPVGTVGRRRARTPLAHRRVPAERDRGRPHRGDGLGG